MKGLLNERLGTTKGLPLHVSSNLEGQYEERNRVGFALGVNSLVVHTIENAMLEGHGQAPEAQTLLKNRHGNRCDPRGQQIRPTTSRGTLEPTMATMISDDLE